MNEIAKYKRLLTNEIRNRAAHVFPTVVNKNSARYNELHPSSYPFCGLQQAYSEAKDLPPKEFNFYGEHYTSVGTAMHELIQKYMGHKGVVIGYWKCLKCKTEINKGKPKTCPSNCAKCGHNIFEYLEVGISYKKYTRGHIDGIIKLGGKYFIIDYKSTSKEKNEKHRLEGNVYPYKKNVAQIKSYVHYFEKEYDIEISGWFLIYVDRDRSLQNFVVEGGLVTKRDKLALAKQCKVYEKQFSRVMKLRKASKKEYWDYLIKTKPCETMKDYKKNFHEYDMCPLAVGGLCFNKTRLKNTVANFYSKIKLVDEL